MNIPAAAEALMRQKLLEEMYDRMTDDEKRLFIQLTLQQRSADEIKKVLQEQSAQLQDLRRRQQTFSQDFISNILGNATWDGALWVINRLARLVK
jgi:carboxypeptidase C (cathepsin A)